MREASQHAMSLCPVGLNRIKWGLQNFTDRSLSLMLVISSAALSRCLVSVPRPPRALCMHVAEKEGGVASVGLGSTKAL